MAGQRVERGVDRRAAACRDSSAVGGSCAQVPLGAAAPSRRRGSAPTRTPPRRRRGPARSSRPRCRRPAPVGRRPVRQPAGRAGVGQRRLLGAGDHLRRRPRAARATPAVKTSALAASRAAEVAQKRTRRATPCSRDDGGVLVDRGEDARPAPRRRAGRSGRRPGRAAPSASRGPARSRAGRRVEVGDEQLDGVGAAVDARRPGVTAAPARPARRTGPAAQNSPSASSTSSPSGLTPRPWASDWPASTCRHLTRSGMPPAEMPSISGTCPIASRGLEVALVRGAVGRRRGRGRRRAARSSPPSAREPSSVADQRGGAGAGQVEGRRERGAVGQPRLGGRRRRGCRSGQRWPTARDRPGRAAQLRSTTGLVGRRRVGDHGSVTLRLVRLAAGAERRRLPSAGCRPRRR